MIFFKKHKIRKIMVRTNKLISEYALQLYENTKDFETHQIIMIKKIRDYSTQVIESKTKLKSVESAIFMHNKMLEKYLALEKLEKIRNCMISTLENLTLKLEIERERDVFNKILKDSMDIYNAAKNLTNMKYKLIKTKLKK